LRRASTFDRRERTTEDDARPRRVLHLNLALAALTAAAAR
jgi:hypothetical protein